MPASCHSAGSASPAHFNPAHLTAAHPNTMPPQHLQQLQQQLAQTLAGHFDNPQSSIPQPTTPSGQQRPEQPFADTLGAFAPNQPLIDLVDSCGKTALHHAARDGKVAAVQRLIAAGADTEKQDHQGATPLLWAAQQGHEKVCMAEPSSLCKFSVQHSSRFMQLCNVNKQQHPQQQQQQL